jgi:hypothetical protein
VRFTIPFVVKPVIVMTCEVPATQVCLPDGRGKTTPLILGVFTLSTVSPNPVSKVIDDWTIIAGAGAGAIREARFVRPYPPQFKFADNGLTVPAGPVAP